MIGLLSFLILLKSNLTDTKVEVLLNIMISTISITLAILVTYFFSKLFSEKSERINRKIKIDDLSIKITAIRRLAHNLRVNREFWLDKVSILNQLNTIYKELTLKQFQVLTIDNIKLEKHHLADQAFTQFILALRGLENGQNKIEDFYETIKRNNYNCEELSMFIECCNVSSDYLFNNDLKSVDSDSLYERKIQEDFKYVSNDNLDAKNYRIQLARLFLYCNRKTIPDCLYLTKLNSEDLPIHFKWVSINFLINILLVISSVFIYSLNLSSVNLLISTKIVVAVFMANTIDLTIGLFASIKRELSIQEFFKL